MYHRITVVGEKVPKEDGEDGETEWDIVQDHLYANIS